MKKNLLLLAALLPFFGAFGQDNDQKLPPSIGFQFSFIDFKTANAFRTKSIAQVLRDKQIAKIPDMSPALTINYMQGLNNNLDFMGRLTTSFVTYPFRNAPAVSEKFYFEVDANVNVKLLSNNYFVVPYIQGGVGFAKAGGTYLAQIPLGLGLQFNIFDEAFVHITSNYRVPVAQKANYNFLHSFGVSVPLSKRKEPAPAPPPPPPPPPPDKDGDGILDADDACPDVAGLASLKGCPDSDKDGIADKDDKCPDVFGMAKYGGCPIPDTDKDGINDEVDKCPTVPGVARYEGCPIPDSDGDGVNDEEDKCPAVPGVASNAGCPEIKEEVKQKIAYAAKNIFFNTGSAQLLKKSFKPLDEVATILKDNPTLLLDIEGHTDNTGKPEKNQALSESRAAAVKAYLLSKGIDASRLTAAGYGQDRPVADNKTAAGRAKNRRSELKLRSY
ncbi:MAG: OmpA family protein [Chitinophagaceae bacterium]|nr:OmpA family protein [Chitinophagaceae bacterium]